MTIRVALIGCGLMARAHTPGYVAADKRAEVVLCCDNEEVRAKERADHLGGTAAVTTDWQAAIASERVDAVDICAPHFLHAPMVRAAAKAGKHILLEKPMALNLEEACGMVAATKAADRLFMIAQNQRYLPEHWRIKALLEQGAIGQVLAARIDGNQFLKNIYPPGHWLFSQTLTGGGVIRTTAIHKIDLLRYLIGEPHRVTAFHRKSGLNPNMDNEDMAAFALEFENGAIGDAFFTFAAHQNPIQTASGELVILYGTKGMISNVGSWQLYSTELEGFDKGLTSLNLPNADYGGSFINEVLHFIECIETGKTPLSSGGDNLHTMATIDALYQSAATGQATTIDPVCN